MKRHGDLFDSITSFDNLLAAARAAYRGKRLRAAPATFHYDLERNLLRLQDELRLGHYEPGPYRAFRITDPKPRLISAAPYRDRVVHHAVCRVIEPLFDRTFIYDSYANRLGKGTHRALDRATAFCRQAPYVLKCDVEKFFPSIDHAVLLDRLARKLKCPRTLDLLGRIVANSNPQESVVRYFPGDALFTPHQRRHGIPIGNLTSQFFANVMLDPLDHFVKENLRCPRYLRFADDFLVFGRNRGELRAVLERLRGLLAPLRLALHPRKCVVLPVSAGVPFLGWRLFPDHRRLRRSTGVRFQRRLRQLSRAYAGGAISLGDVRAPLASWIGHLRHGDTWGLRRRLLGDTLFRVRAGGPYHQDSCSHGGGSGTVV
ncbi:MAG: group II intron reverse transcriptase domain-containing protein [Deltaproteobacteria bacterium]|nr:group II intron reverse transcriptase domain-containing protein [Deltaproteobacteria bacterium]